MKIIPSIALLLCGMLHAATPSAERLEQAQQELQLIQSIHTQCHVGEEFTPAQARILVQREHKLLQGKKISLEAAGSLLLHKINLLVITCQNSDDLAQFRQEMSEAQACYPELAEGITAGLASIFKDGDEAFLQRCRPLQEICIKRLQSTRAERQALSEQFVKELALLDELAKDFP